MPLETLKTALREVEEKVPFNNFRTDFDLQGEDFPEALGGNCYHQAAVLVAKLGTEFKIGYLQEIGGNHVVLYARHKPTHSRFILDPMMLIGEPMPLDTLLKKNAEPLSFHVGAPDRAGNTRARVEYMNRGKDRFAATLYNNRFDPDDYTEYLYDTSLRASHVPCWTPETYYVSDNRRDKMVLKFALPDRGVVVFRYDVPERVLNCTHDNAQGGYRRYSDAHGEEAMEKFTNVQLERFGLDYRGFRKLLMEAVRLQDQFMPVKPAVKKRG